jgi:Uma2 family endonuclease
MVQFQSKQWLLTEDDLPETDNIPVDNELQIIIPALLRAILAYWWAERTDWYFGINLGVYYDPDESAIGPDAFLSLGVERYRASGKLRLSYVIPQENNVVPQWVLEIVSKSPGKEYDDKQRIYAQMGVLYYTIYNPEYSKRDEHEPFEVYRLEKGVYIRLEGNPVWMPEIGLGIGFAVGRHEELTRQWLYWFDENGDRYPTPDELRQQERLLRERSDERAEQAEQRAEELAQRLRDLGVEP